jgi:Icc-related predicted phosphoesterase
MDRKHERQVLNVRDKILHSEPQRRFRRMRWKAHILDDPSQAKPTDAIRLLCFSDTHGFHESIPASALQPADLAIFAGDFSLYGHPNNIESFTGFLHTLAIPVVVIAGNCDLSFDTQRLEHFRATVENSCHPPIPIESIKPAFLANLGNIIYLEESATTVKGLKIWGSPYSPNFNGSAFSFATEDAPAKWAAIPDDVDIIVAHGPPKDVADALASGPHVGCPELRKAIERVQPALSVFGHIHEAHGGWGMIGETLCVNVAILGGFFKPHRPPTFIDLTPALANSDTRSQFTQSATFFQRL